jgi:hypothetical protein
MEKMATEKQVAFIRRLAQERSVDVSRDLSQGFTVREASAFITKLLSMPVAAAAVVAAAASGALDLSGLVSGRYAVEVDGVYKFLKVDNIQEEGNYWNGWVFVKIQASDEWHKLGAQRPHSGAYSGKSPEYLRLVLADPKAASIAYGRELGVCGVCGRTLTDPESIAKGIGPICEGRFS